LEDRLGNVGSAVLDKILIRTILQPYWRLTRSQTLGVQGIVIQGGSEILLVRHSYVRGWHIPGGGVERHENLEQALGRELLEETGLAIRGKSKLHGIFSNFERSKGDHIAVYIVNDWERIHAGTSRLEILEQRFFEVNSLPSDLIEGARRRLAEVFNNQSISNEW
jgi:ADP-ribose pyrophosphatase YjhB (NUDIX family)